MHKLIPVLVLLSTLASAQLPVPLEVKESTWIGSTGPVANHSNDPVTQGLPIADSDGVQCGASACSIGSTNVNLQLQNASGTIINSQFRVLALWPSGNVKYVLIDGQDSPGVGATDYTINVVKTTGSGTNGGSNIITDNEDCAGNPNTSLLCANTGTAKFQIKKINFNLFDDVLIGSTHVVSSSNHGATDGLVLTGPRTGQFMPGAVSCGTIASPDITQCTTVYLSNQDSASTYTIEDNGPVRATVKISGNFINGSTVYMHWTARLTFYLNKNNAKIQVIAPRNADGDSCLGQSNPGTACNNSFNMAYKQFRQLEARLTQNLSSGARTVTFAVDTAGATVTTNLNSTLSTDSAYLYQAFTNQAEWGDWVSATNCTGEGDTCVWSYINRAGNGDGPSHYTQNGWVVQSSESISGSPTSGDYTKEVAGWADTNDASGAGVEIGVKYLTYYWPKSLEYRNGGSELRIGIWPDQAEFPSGSCSSVTSPCAIPYTQSWTGATLHDLFFNFHASSLANEADDFYKFQHPLVARAAPSNNGNLAYQYYNNAKDATSGLYALGFEQPSPVDEDLYYQTLPGVTCNGDAGTCLKDVGDPSIAMGMKIFRFYNWTNAGGGNDHDFGWGNLLQYVNRGLPGRWVFGTNFYRMVSERSYPRSDFPGGFRGSTSCPAANCPGLAGPTGFPDTVNSVNGLMRNHVDTLHEHAQGLIDYYLLTGDEAAKDQLLQGIKDAYANPNVLVNNGSVSPNHVNVLRWAGHRLMMIGEYSTFLRSIGDPDAATVLRSGDNIVSYSLMPNLYTAGYGTESCTWSGVFYVGQDCSHGVSRVRGLAWLGGESDDWAQIRPTAVRTVKPFMTGILVSGLRHYMLAANAVRSPLWTATIGNYTIGDLQLRSFLYGISKGQVTEDFVCADANGNPVACVSAVPSASGLPYIIPLDYQVNSTTCGTVGGGCARVCTNDHCSPQEAWGVWEGMGDVVGSVNDMSGVAWQPTFEIQARKQGFYGQSPTGDWGQYHSQVLVNYVLDSRAATPPTQLKPITLAASPGCTPTGNNTVSCSGATSYALSWTPPTDVAPRDGLSLWLKGTSNGTDIVDWLGFTDYTTGCGTDAAIDTNVAFPPAGTAYNQSVGCWQYNPANYTAFWAAQDATTEPANTGSSTISGLNSRTTYHFALKYYGNGGSGGSGGGTAPPSVTITAPSSGSTVSGMTTITANATDKVGVASVMFQADGKQIGTSVTAPPYAVSLNTTQLSNGQHTLTAVATDVAGKSAQASVTVAVNNSTGTTPTVVITSPAAGATVSGTMTVSANATDRGGVASVVFQADGKQIGTSVTAPPYAVSLNTTQLSNGQHTLTAVATDVAGKSAQASVTVAVNNSTGTTPTVVITSPAAGATVSGTMTVSANATDSGGMASVVFQADGKQIGTSVTAPPYAVSLNTTQLSNGQHTLTAVATDVAGKSAQASVTVAVNNSTGTTPTVVITSPAAGATVSATMTVSANATDRGGVASVVFQADGKQIGTSVTAPPYAVSLNTTQLSNGQHTLTAMATDVAGKSAQASVTVAVNNSTGTTPTVVITSPAAGATVSGTMTVSANATDRWGVASILFQVDGRQISMPVTATPYAVSLNTTQLSNGWHTLTAVAIDPVGHRPRTSVPVMVSNSWGSVPKVMITSPTSGATVSGTMMVSANATNSGGVASVLFQVDGRQIGMPVTATPYTVSVSTTQLSNGWHALTAVATDLAGHSAQATVPVIVSNSTGATSPTVVITMPTAGATVSGTVPVTANATDNGGVASVAFQADGKQIGSPVTALPYAVSLNTTQLSNGQHTLTAVATDLAGKSAQASVTVAVNNSTGTTPTAVITAPAAGATVSGTITVSANATDSGGVANVAFQADGKQIGSPVTASPYAVSLNTTQLSNGQHTLTAVATDLAGKSAQASVTVAVNNSTGTTPTAVITAPAAGATVSGTITVSANATDSGGVANVAFQADGKQIGSPVTASPYAVSLNTTQLSNGQHTLTAVATDLAGNSGQASLAVTVSNATGSNPCSGNGWCTIYSADPSGFGNNGWNNLFFSHDTGKFYLYGNNTAGITPEGNSFWSYTSLSAPISSNPWTKVSSCGDNTLTQTNGQPYHLVDSITAATGTCPGGCTSSDKIHVALNSGRQQQRNPFPSGSSVSTPKGGTIGIGNEAIGYDTCTTDPNNPVPTAANSCAVGSGPDFYLWGYDFSTGQQQSVRRGVRQMAGRSAATAHSGGTQAGPNNDWSASTAEPANLACANPALGSSWDSAGNGSPTGTNPDNWDHPPDRHSVANEFYDPKRGRIWVSFGFEESWTMQDTWSLCVFPIPGVTTAATHPWDQCAQPDTYDQPSTTMGWQRVPWSAGPPWGSYNAGIYENASIYDPDDDVIVELGGMADSKPSTSNVWVFCLTAGANAAFGCTDPIDLNKWVKITSATGFTGSQGKYTYSGNPGARDGERLAYDSVNHRILAFGGALDPTHNWNSVAMYSPKTGEWCLSYLTAPVSGFNGGNGEANSSAPWCAALPSQTGTPPPLVVNSPTSSTCPSAPCPLRTLKFPSWTYDNNPNVDQAVFFAGPTSWDGGGVYLYNSSLNKWTHTGAQGGPTYDPDFTSHQTWAYDDVDDVFVWVQGGSSTTYPPALWQLPGTALGLP